MYARLIGIPLLLLSLSVPASFGAVESENPATSSSGTVSGNVKDSAGAVLQGAQIVLQPSGATAASNAQGDFIISGVKPGTYTATVSYVGFKTSVTTIVVTGGLSAQLNTTMSVGSGTEQIVVNADLTGDALAINEQRTSENILNVETDAQILALPNANIADAVGRLPGVTLQRNEGEGQYVQIRGTEPRLSNTTIDGVIVPGPDTQVRQVDLSVIPSDLVGSVAINKTLSANQNGDAIGGSVDLRVKQAGSEPTLSMGGNFGNTPIAGGRQVQTYFATVGKRFGPGQKLGAILGYSYDHNARGIDDVEPSPGYLSDNVTPTFTSENIQEYLYDRSRWGFGGSLDYKLASDSDLYVHGLFSNFKDYGEKWAYQLDGAAADFANSVRRPNEQIADLAIGGNHIFSHSFLTYQVAAARSRFGGAAGNPGADFAPIPGSNLDQLDQGMDANGNPLTVGPCAYNPSASPSKYRPVFTGCTTPGYSIYDPTQYQLKDINTTTGQATQLNLQAGGAMGFNYHLGSHASTFEFGGQFRNEHKGQHAYSPTYDYISGNPPSPGNPPAGVTPPMTQFLDSFTNPHFYGGTFQLGPVTNFDSVLGYLNANPGALPLDAGSTALNSDASNYNLEERVSAGYIMNTIELGSRFHLQTGLRIEATNTSNTGYLVTNDANGNYLSTSPTHGSGSYINPMPSVQLRYKIDGESDIRAVYGRGISRPDPYELVTYITLDETKNPYQVSVGNPSLVAEHANDYDVLYERFLPSVGMIEAGYFYKALSDPIYPQQSTITAASALFPASYVGYTLIQSVNGDTAHVQGIEVAYQQHWNFLPGVLAGARMNANFTYTSSKANNVIGRSDNPALVGQAPYSWNIEPAYATKRALVSVGITHNSANIYAYQYTDGATGGTQGANGDNYFFSHTQIDAQATYYLGKGFSVLASGENMNNEVFGFYNGSTSFMTQREYYKPTYTGGIKWEFHHE